MPDFQRPALFTERLMLRRPEQGDAAAIIAAVGDRDVACRLARVPHPYGPADAALFLERVVPAEWVWAITRPAAPGLIGVVGLTPVNDGTAELGYWLARPHWGAGIATEAASAVMAYGLEQLRLARITSGYFADNPASGRVLDKLGFIEVGQTMRPCLARGHDVPSIEVRHEGGSDCSRG